MPFIKLLQPILDLLHIPLARAVEIQVGLPGTEIQPGSTIEDIGGEAGFLEQIFQFGVWLAIILALGMIIYGGYLYLISGANASKSGAGKSKIQDAIVGLLLALSSIVILAFINPDLAKPILPSGLQRIDSSGINWDQAVGSIGSDGRNLAHNTPYGEFCSDETRCYQTSKCDTTQSKYRLPDNVLALRSPNSTKASASLIPIAQAQNQRIQVYDDEASCSKALTQHLKSKDYKGPASPGTCIPATTCRSITDDELSAIKEKKNPFGNDPDGKYYVRFLAGEGTCNPDQTNKRGNCFDESTICNGINGQCQLPSRGWSSCVLPGDCASDQCEDSRCVAINTEGDKQPGTAPNHVRDGDNSSLKQKIDQRAGKDDRYIYKLVKSPFGWVPLEFDKRHKARPVATSCTDRYLTKPLPLNSVYKECFSLSGPPLHHTVNKERIKELTHKQINKKEADENRQLEKFFADLSGGYYSIIEGIVTWTVGYRTMGYQHYMINRQGEFEDVSCKTKPSYGVLFDNVKAESVPDSQSLESAYDRRIHNSNQICVLDYACCKASDNEVCKNSGLGKNVEARPLAECLPHYPKLINPIPNKNNPLMVCCRAKEQKSNEVLSRERQQQKEEECKEKGGEIIIPSDKAQQECRSFCSTQALDYKNKTGNDVVYTSLYKNGCCTCPITEERENEQGKPKQ